MAFKLYLSFKKMANNNSIIYLAYVFGKQGSWGSSKENWGWAKCNVSVECSRMVKVYLTEVCNFFLQIIALADAAEENQANMFQAFTKLKSATQLVILLISLWQKLSADQVAILEATFLPLTQDTQELVRIS